MSTLSPTSDEWWAVVDRRLRYSERKQVSATGGLGPLTNDLPTKLQPAVVHYLNYASGRMNSHVRPQWQTAVEDALGRHLGDNSLTRALSNRNTDSYLDVIEILAEESLRRRTWRVPSRGGAVSVKAAVPIPSVVTDLNEIFDIHRFAYVLTVEGMIQPIASPLLHDVIVTPALLAAARPGWEQVENSYREAIDHLRRADEWEDALTASAASAEAALKAAGYSGATLGALAKSYRNSPAAAGFSPAIVENLVDLLTQLMAWRSHAGSAHGKAPGSNRPPRELVALAVHWAGAFIAYIAESA